MKKIQNILIVILILAFSVQFLQFFTRHVKFRSLKGVTNEVEIPPLTIQTWVNGKYQDQVTKYFEMNFGFRPFFIRLFNQMDYSLFHTTNANGVVIGKKDFLYEEWFVRDYLGYYYIGLDSIRRNVEKLSAIRKFLNSYNTELLVMLSPGKAYYYPEYIPDYFKRIRDTTNYSVYAETLGQSEIPFFDANRWFLEMKDTIAEPLFSQTGTHWSNYGAELTADSLLKLSGQVLKRKMNLIRISGVEWTNEPRDTDDDLGKLMNLFWPISKMKLAYPVIEHINHVPQSETPSVIVISDSFFWNIYNDAINQSFSSISYWYYYSSIFPDSYSKKTTVKDIAVPDKILNTDLVILMTSTAGLNKIGFGFIDDFYHFVKLDEDQRIDSLRSDFVKVIHNTPEMLNLAKDKAEQKNIPLDSIIWTDADQLAKKRLQLPD